MSAGAHQPALGEMSHIGHHICLILTCSGSHMGVRICFGLGGTCSDWNLAQILHLCSNAFWCLPDFCVSFQSSINDDLWSNQSDCIQHPCQTSSFRKPEFCFVAFIPIKVTSNWHMDFLFFEDFCQVSFLQGAGFSLCISNNKNAEILKIQWPVQEIMHGSCVSSHIEAFCHAQSCRAMNFHLSSTALVVPARKHLNSLCFEWEISFCGKHLPVHSDHIDSYGSSPLSYLWDAANVSHPTTQLFQVYCDTRI